MKTLLVVLGAVSAIAASTTVLAFLGLPYKPLGLEFLQINPYTPVSVASEVSGSTEPEQVEGATMDDSVTNGDFTIFLAGGDDTTLGNGKDEVTVWDFDFTGDPQFDSFPTSGNLQSALLSLTLTPKSARVDSDVIRISGLANITPPAYAGLTENETTTVEVDLLDHYTSEEILGALQEGDGQISMASQDDAIVSAAELTLVAAQ
jgi:hypothetical protein